LKKLKNIEKELNSKDNPPFLSDNLYKSLNKVFKDVENEVQSQIDLFKEMSEDDNIFNRIDDLFKGKITEKPNTEVLKKIYIEGKGRYAEKIPPGYEDNKKPENEKYGDYIFWKQMNAVVKIKELQTKKNK
jgi:hypothetical protein